VPVKTKYNDIQPSITKDGSEVRELMHPDIFPDLKQSLAEAIVPVGGATILHRHLKSDEIYHITGGQGIMVLEDERTDVFAGDTIFIPAGTHHKIRNPGDVPLKILCFCCPAYSHEDTELTES
jgi:mannose-6-phosphate isomerase-like protein (cupin superfamily)